MIISHSEETHKPVHLNMVRKEYTQADLYIDFKASALNNARWTCTYHDFDEVWLSTDDSEAITFAKELEEYLGKESPKCIIDNEIHKYSINHNENDYLSIKVYCEVYEQFYYSEPYDDETEIEVL